MPERGVIAPKAPFKLLKYNGNLYGRLACGLQGIWQVGENLMSIDASYLSDLSPYNAAMPRRRPVNSADVVTDFQSLINPTLRDIAEGQAKTAVPVGEKSKIEDRKDQQENDKSTSADKPEDKETYVKETYVYEERPLNGNDNAESVKPVDGGDFNLADIIDVINPLQNFPVIGSIYRYFSGDEISGTARVIGGAIYGGPLGLLLAASNAIYAQEHNDKDFGEVIIAEMRGENDDQKQTQIASESTAEQNTTASDSADESPATPANIAELPEAEAAAPMILPASQTADRSDVLKPIPSVMMPQQIDAQQMPEYMMRALDKYEALIRDRNQRAIAP